MAALTEKDCAREKIQEGGLEHDAEKLAPDLIRGGCRFPENPALGLDPRDHAPTIALSGTPIRRKGIPL
jgi:hypothetical protein